MKNELSSSIGTLFSFLHFFFGEVSIGSGHERVTLPPVPPQYVSSTRIRILVRTYVLYTTVELLTFVRFDQQHFDIFSLHHHNERAPANIIYTSQFLKIILSSTPPNIDVGHRTKNIISFPADISHFYSRERLEKRNCS